MRFSSWNRQPNRHHAVRPKIESLEDRTLMATCFVTRLSDVGAGMGFRGDMRYCINKVNSQPGADSIEFTVTGTINLNSALPDLASNITIKGPGAGLMTVRRNTSDFYRIFTVPTGSSVRISGLAIQNGEVKGVGDDEGGGISNAGTLTLIKTVVKENKATGEAGAAYGGGISNTGSLTVIDSTISNNYVSGLAAKGAGIANRGGAAIYTSAITHNMTTPFFDDFGFGGGFYNTGDLVVDNSTISDNEGQFGSAFRIDDGYAVITHSTIFGNIDTQEPSAAFEILGDASVVMANTILAGSSGKDISGVLAFSDYNLIGDSEGGSGYGTHDMLDADPLLGPLTDNGGPTHTRALLPGSPAINAGDNTDAPPFDQRGPGFARVVNGTIDIGAFEVQASPAPSISLRAEAPFDSLAPFLVTADLD